VGLFQCIVVIEGRGKEVEVEKEKNNKRQELPRLYPQKKFGR